ncbi:MAG: hypothetical protein WCJ91_06235, partial [Actinomycetes bacterium]
VTTSTEVADTGTTASVSTDTGTGFADTGTAPDTGAGDFASPSAPDMAALVAEGFRAEPTVASFDTVDTGTTAEAPVEVSSDHTAAPAVESASSPSADFAAAPAVAASEFPASPSAEFHDVLPAAPVEPEDTGVAHSE